MSQCPCGSGQTLDACCAPYHAGTPAPTAVALMRSRYTAFVLGDGEYLDKTLSEKQRAEFSVEEFNATSGDTKWLGLEIRKFSDGGENDEAGTVEFVAKYRHEKNQVAHHELAMFTRDEDNNWIFADCIMNPKEPQRFAEKIGRNDPCTCGSGKKYKKCCGGN